MFLPTQRLVGVGAEPFTQTAANIGLGHASFSKEGAGWPAPRVGYCASACGEKLGSACSTPSTK